MAQNSNFSWEAAREDQYCGNDSPGEYAYTACIPLQVFDLSKLGILAAKQSKQLLNGRAAPLTEAQDSAQ